MRCTAGAIFDVLVDMRENSPSYRHHFHVRLDARNRDSLFIPSGVAHGYQALEDGTEVLYLTDEFYSPGLERGVRYNDPSLNLPWPLTPRDVTERDQRWPLLA